eukprot:m.312668 g.312668  ORF g.312668 m.312668 type:complete len:127 (-) comp23048_c0_seq36:2132-2512(-)
MSAAHLPPTINKWDAPVLCIAKGPQSASCSLMPVNDFHYFSIPFVMDGATTHNPCHMPDVYAAALQDHLMSFKHLRERLQDADMDEQAKTQFSSAVQTRFMEWLTEHGHTRELSDLQDLERRSIVD